MTEFVPRAEHVTAANPVSAGVRSLAPLSIAATGRDRSLALPQDAGDGVTLSNEDTARAFASYSKVQTQIAKVVADVGGNPPRNSPADLAQSENALLSLMPQPTMVLPLPPADADMVAFVAQVTQSIARQVAQARAAFSNVAAPVVDAATA